MEKFSVCPAASWCGTENNWGSLRFPALSSYGRGRDWIFPPTALLIKLKSRLASCSWILFVFPLNLPAPICFRQTAETNKRLLETWNFLIETRMWAFFTFRKEELENIPPTSSFVLYQSLVPNYSRHFSQGWPLSIFLTFISLCSLSTMWNQSLNSKTHVCYFFSCVPEHLNICLCF